MGGRDVNLDRDRLGSALIRPPAGRLRRYVETERAERALRRNNRQGDRATLDAAITAFERAAAASAPGDSDEDPTDPFRWAPYIHVGR
jgi:hypothetical protein